MKAIISGGGSGGHIFPAVAIAGALKQRHPDVEILFVGAEGRMEMEKVPAAGYRIEGLPIAGLQRKLKQTMGITPQELLSEARIKHACKLLRTSEKTVAEVAYACGFSDPKYFSKCFKQSTGKTPSEYKNAS